jgi:hypothetical protein
MFRFAKSSGSGIVVFDYPPLSETRRMERKYRGSDNMQGSPTQLDEFEQMRRVPGTLNW